MYFDFIFDKHLCEIKSHSISEKSILSPDDCMHSLLRCLLSSQISYEKAVTGAEIIMEGYENLLFLQHCERSGVIKSVLKSPLVRHRFPNVKAEQASKCIEVWNRGGFDQTFSKIVSEAEQRDIVVVSFPGMGMKQSSMFLRDIGYSHSLAVIDTHILWYLKNLMGIEYRTLDRKAYLDAEKHINIASATTGVSTSLFDKALWYAVREFKELKRRLSCSVQYALPLEG